ncbi:sugar O-acetyltransferase [Alkalicoccobacillus gibsonii]|uniref:sugar O-acetyltransferase n=1 Tax=Alkalicoccobacillus gibsonii TaxID=79881 RepID=UPI003F7C3951
MIVKDIFNRDRAGETISIQDPEFPKMAQAIERAQELVAKLNTGYHSTEEVRKQFFELTTQEIDHTFELLPPFYTDFGQNITVGSHVFINSGCTFMDRGGITIGDHVLIAPKVNLVTTNHPISPSERRATISKPINIKNNAWIGIAATIMPGVTIGENSIISAGAVVTKDVPDNVIVAGVPAKVIKSIEE